jgi:hypothetical protein
MVSYNVYKATSSGAYVEGVCLASDEKPVVGIANGSILYAVDASNGETTRYMYDKETMSWIEAECPCHGGGSGGGSGGGGNANILIVHATVGPPAEGSSEPTITLDKTYAEIDAAISAGALVCVDVVGGEGNIIRLPFMRKDPSIGDFPAALVFSAASTPTGMSLVCLSLTLTSSDSASLLQYSAGGKD